MPPAKTDQPVHSPKARVLVHPSLDSQGRGGGGGGGCTCHQQRLISLYIHPVRQGFPFIPLWIARGVGGGGGCRSHMPPAKTDQPVHPPKARVLVHPSLDSQGRGGGGGGCRRHMPPAKTDQPVHPPSKARVLVGLGGSVGCAVRLETRRSRVQPPPRSATFFRGD